MKKEQVRIIKGKEDSYVEALSEFCRQRGYRIIEESVIIEMPSGRELLQFKRDVRAGKIKIVE